MGKKRDRPSNTEVEKSESSDNESMGDTDEEITFDAMTKEERMKRNESLGIIEDEEDEEDEDEDEEDEDEDELVNIDFGFSDPKECHFKSIRNFLRYLLLGSGKFDYSPLADEIINQVEVGSIVEVNDEEDAYAFLTILHLQFYKNNKTISDILNVLKKKCPKEKKEAFDNYLKKNTGLLLNERMRNFPPQVMPPLYNSLDSDIKWALENSENKNAFKYDYFMVIAPCCEDPDVEKNQNGKKQKLCEPQLLYYHFEEEIMKKYAELSFSFEVGQLGDETLSELTKQYREVLIVPFSKYYKILQEIEECLQ